MAMTRLSGPTPRMTLSRALLSEALRLARSPLAAVHLVCGLAAGLACGEYFSVTRWDPALGADAYAQFLGALMPLMSAIVCGLAVDEERAAGRLANLTAVPSRGRAVAAKLLALAALSAGALAVALGVFGAVLAVAGRLPLGPPRLRPPGRASCWAACPSTRWGSAWPCASAATPPSALARRGCSSRSSQWADLRTAS